MATATRIAQDRKRIDTTRTEVAKTYVTTEVDGRVRAKDQIAESVVISPDVRYESQPDRVRLDLSLEEAQMLFTVVGNVAGGGAGRKHTQAVYDAFYKAGVPYQKSQTIGLTGVLSFPVSPLKDTPASSNGGGCSPVDPTVGQMKQSGTATTGSGHAKEQARRDAEKERYLHYLGHQW